MSAWSTQRVSSAASPTAGPRPPALRDESTVAFLNVNPAATGHTPVAPKPHVEDIVAAEPGRSAAVFAAARTVAGATEAALDVDDNAVSVSLARRDLDDERGAALAERIREAR